MATEEYMTSQEYSATVGGVVYNVSVAISGTLDFSTNKTFGGDVTVEGALIADAITGPTTITGNTVVTGTLGATGNVTVGGDLDVTGGDISLYGYRLITFGEGSPEGAKTGVVGCLYLRVDGGANTTLYVKESGTGNTGWAAK